VIVFVNGCMDQMINEEKKECHSDSNIPGPMTPRPNPGLPEETLPPTSRPAEIIEEKMVIKPTHIKLVQEALRARGLNPDRS